MEETTFPDERLELIFTCCHPALGGRGADRADVACARRADHRGDRPRLPGRRGDDEAAAVARETQDPRCRHPVPRSRRPSAPGAAGRGARGRLSDLQRGLRRPRRPRRRGAAARRGAHRAHARRARGARPARADALARCAPRGPVRRGRARAARGPGPLALGRGGDLPRACGARPLARACAAPGHTSSRRRSRRCTWTSRTTGPRSPRSTASSPS